MSSRTPSRISLRKKRLCNEFESNEPASKRISPAKNDKLDLDKKKNESKEIIVTDNSSVASTFMTPKNCNKKGSKRPVQTPKTFRDVEGDTPLDNKNEGTESEFSLSQSPSQFPSSQMPSTQDMEVVWDCNSPGYSKEELKKMGDCLSEKSSNTSPVPIPNRLLFSKLKRPPLPLSPIHFPKRLNSKNSMVVAAELDSLLTKVNGERILQLQEQSSEDDEPLHGDISNILNSSSQPFDVSNLEEENLNDSIHNPKESKFKNNSVTYDEVSIPLVKNEVKQKDIPAANVSLSFDDDDLFSESFLMSTQALEESVLKKEQDRQKSNLTICNRRSPLSRIRKKTPTVIDDDSKQLKHVKIKNEITDTPVTPKIFNDREIGPDSSSPIFNKTNKVDYFSFTNNSSDKVCENKAKQNLQNNFNNSSSLLSTNSSCLLNAKTSSDENLSKNTIRFKGIKPRATFQLNIPSSQSLQELFTSKFSSSEERKTSDSSYLTNASNTEKFNRSKSESSHLSTAIDTKIKSCNSLVESNFKANTSQELDDDDAIFASLMPALIEAEAEHVKKLSQESKVNCEATTATDSEIPSAINSFLSSSVSNKKFSSFHNNNNNSHNKFSTFKSSNFQTKSTASNSSSSIQSFNKSSCAKTFPAPNIPFISEKKNNFSEEIIESCTENQGNSLKLDLKDRGKKFEIKDKRPGILPDFAGEFEDDDDNIFLEEGVLDYISHVESQYISSQCSPQKSDANSSTPVKESTSSRNDSTDSFFALNISGSPRKHNIPIESESSKNRSEKDPRNKNQYQKSLDNGSKMLMNEFFKVGETADKLKKVLNCDLSKNIKEDVVKRTSSSTSVVVKNTQNSENILSDEDLFNVTFEEKPNQSSYNQNAHKNKLTVSKGQFQRNCNNSSNINTATNSKTSTMTNFQGNINMPTTRSRSIITSSNIASSNKMKSVSKVTPILTTDKRGANYFNSNSKFKK